MFHWLLTLFCSQEVCKYYCFPCKKCIFFSSPYFSNFLYHQFSFISSVLFSFNIFVTFTSIIWWYYYNNRIKVFLPLKTNSQHYSMTLNSSKKMNLLLSFLRIICYSGHFTKNESSQKIAFIWGDFIFIHNLTLINDNHQVDNLCFSLISNVLRSLKMQEIFNFRLEKRMNTIIAIYVF